MRRSLLARSTFLWLFTAVLSGCSHLTKPGAHLARNGDEIVVAGQLFHTGTPVVLWLDPEGYDAYRVERRFAPLAQSDWKSSHEQNPELTTPNRFGMRKDHLSDWQIEQMRGGGMDLLTLQGLIDEFVIHYDVSGTSRQCFKTLHDARDLSVHFMLDLDGTLYQTLDVKERAWHATSANSRSIGIEIANIGAYPPNARASLDQWYQADAKGNVSIQVPAGLQPSGIRTENFVGHPARRTPILGKIQGQELEQYDFTPEQYAALIKLTATLCKIFPNLPCDYPRDEHGAPITEKLSDEKLQAYRGLIGHYHIQANKVDPGPAFQWEKVTREAQKLLREN